MNTRRDIPAVRVAAFINQYMSANYETTEDGKAQFAFEARVNVRQLYRVLNNEIVNLKFEWVDNMLVSLDREYLWHWSPESGGFADYYGDTPAPAAEPSIEQQRYRTLQTAKRLALKKSTSWMTVLRERAEVEMAA